MNARRHHLRDLRDALVNVAVNPFAQSTRLVPVKQNTRPFSTDQKHWRSAGTPKQDTKPTSNSTPTMSRAMISDDEDMDVGPPPAERRGAKRDSSGEIVERASVTTGGSKGGLLKETPITIQPHHFGLPQTKTVVLAQTSYLSAIAPADKRASPTQFQIRLNSPSDWFVTTGLATPVTSSPYTPGLWGNLLPSGNAATWQSTLAEFPTTLSASEKPQWKKYWELQYQYYTVLGVEVEITFMNPSTALMNDLVVATFMDSASAANSTNIHPLGAGMSIMEQWPDVSFTRVPSCADGDFSGAYRTVKKFYRPGQNKASVENDEDIKTWTKIGSLPSLTELMTVSIGKAWDSPIASAVGLNIRLDMRWIVQYKDLWPAFNWPYNQTAILQAAPSDILFTA